MLTFISNFVHYKEVLSRVQSVKHMLWIGTVDIRDLYVGVGKEDFSSKRKPKELVLLSRGRNRAKLKMPFGALFAQFILHCVDVRLICVKEPGLNFREGFDKYQVLYDRLEWVLVASSPMNM